MKSWTIYLPAAAEPRADSAAAAEEMVSVKEGFSWPAFFVGPLWLIASRMWLVLALWIAGAIAIVLVAERLGDAVEAFLPLLAQWFFALQANDLRRWTLARRGFVLAGIVTAPDKSAAEAAFLRKWARAMAEPPQPAAGSFAAVRAPSRRPPPMPLPPRSGEPTVLGLFPEPRA